MKSGKHNKLSVNFNEKSLKQVTQDLNEHMEFLNKILYIQKKNADFPIAFVTNTLYILERNGISCRDTYENFLLPIIKRKIDLVHSEGVS